MGTSEKPTYEALQQKVRELERALSKQKQADTAPMELGVVPSQLIDLTKYFQ